MKRFSVWGVNLNPVAGSEQGGYRPVLVISPNVMNDKLNTVIVAPMTTRLRGWPCRAPITHQGRAGEVALDQVRALDKKRLEKTMGDLGLQYHSAIIAILHDIFSD